MKRTLLIDSDIIAYKFASATEEVYYFDGKDQPPCVSEDFEAACVGADEYIEWLRDKLDATDVILCITDRGNEFRKDFWPTYKGNRKGRKPHNLFPLLTHFEEKYVCYKRPRLEADDCMGILSTHPTLVPGERIIVSEDKDMASVPGMLFNPAKDKEPRNITKLQADRAFLTQTITGDTTDNYPGAVGIGPKSKEVAGVQVSKCIEEMWRHVIDAFQRSALKKLDILGGPELLKCSEDALIQARAARILRASDWDFKGKRPILWQPPQPLRSST